jgi:RNA polymerase sigma-70 factor (ECF subfamily)
VRPPLRPRTIEGLDTDATADLLGTNSAVIKARLHRARQALRTLPEPVSVTPNPSADAAGKFGRKLRVEAIAEGPYTMIC